MEGITSISMVLLDDIEIEVLLPVYKYKPLIEKGVAKLLLYMKPLVLEIHKVVD